MKIAICDDEKEDITITRKELERISTVLNCNMDILELTDGNTMAEDIINSKTEVVLLDIDMPDVNGMDIANRLAEQVPLITIVFLTNRAELVFQTLKYRPLRFIRKNCLQAELEEAMRAAMQKIASEVYIFQTADGSVKSSYPVKDIIYIESNRHYIEIHIRDGIKRVRGKISDYEKKLEEFGFLRIHMGYLVNIRYISAIKNNRVWLDNEESFPVGRKYREEILIKYTKGLEKFVHGCRI